MTRTLPVAVAGLVALGADATTISARPGASPATPGKSPRSATATWPTRSASAGLEGAQLASRTQSLPDQA